MSPELQRQILQAELDTVEENLEVILASIMVVPYIQGLQSKGVSACVNLASHGDGLTDGGVALPAHGDKMRDDLRDIRSVVAHALDIGDHLHGGGNVAQIARYRLLTQQQSHAAVLNAPLHVVDAVIPLHDLLGGYGVGGAHESAAESIGEGGQG